MLHFLFIIISTYSFANVSPEKLEQFANRYYEDIVKNDDYLLDYHRTRQLRMASEFYDSAEIKPQQYLNPKFNHLPSRDLTKAEYLQADYAYNSKLPNISGATNLATTFAPNQVPLKVGLEVYGALSAYSNRDRVVPSLDEVRNEVFLQYEKMSKDKLLEGMVKKSRDSIRMSYDEKSDNSNNEIDKWKNNFSNQEKVNKLVEDVSNKIQEQLEVAQKSEREILNDYRFKSSYRNTVASLSIASQALQLSNNQELSQKVTIVKEIYTQFTYLANGKVDILGKAVQMNSLELASGYIGLLNLGVSLFSSSKGKDSSAAILKAIEELRKQMHKRFDKVEGILQKLGFEVNEVLRIQDYNTVQLNQIKQTLDTEFKRIESLVRSANYEALNVTLGYCKDRFDYIRVKQLEVTSTHPQVTSYVDECLSQGKSGIDSLSSHLIQLPHLDLLTKNINSYHNSLANASEAEWIKELNRLPPGADINIVLGYAKRFLTFSQPIGINRNHPQEFKIFNNVIPNPIVFNNLYSTYQAIYNTMALKSLYKKDYETFSEMALLVDQSQKWIESYFMFPFAKRLNRLLNIEKSNFLNDLKVNISQRYGVTIGFYSKQDILNFSSVYRTSSKENSFESEIAYIEKYISKLKQYINERKIIKSYTDNGTNDSLNWALRLRNHGDLESGRNFNTAFESFKSTLINFIYNNVPHLADHYDINFDKVMAEGDFHSGTGIFVDLNKCRINNLFENCHNSAVLNDVFIRLKFSPKISNRTQTSPDLAREFTVILNPMYKLYKDHNYNENEALILLNRSKDRIIRAVKVGFAEQAIKASEDYLRFLKNAPVIIKDKELWVLSGRDSLLTPDLADKLTKTLSLGAEYMKTLRKILISYSPNTYFSCGEIVDKANQEIMMPGLSQKNYSSVIDSIHNCSGYARDKKIFDKSKNYFNQAKDYIKSFFVK